MATEDGNSHITESHPVLDYGSRLSKGEQDMDGIFMLDNDNSESLSQQNYTVHIGIIFIILLCVAAVALLIYGIVAWYGPCSSPKDCEFRDLRVQNLTASQNHTICNDATIAGETTTHLFTANNLRIPPLLVTTPTLVLDGSRSLIIVNQAAAPGCVVTLPSATQYPGLFIWVVNEQPPGLSLQVAPVGSDTIHNEPAAITVQGRVAKFVSNGILPSGIGNWTLLHH